MLSPHGCSFYSTSYWSPTCLFTTVTSLFTAQNPVATVCGPGFEPSNHRAQLSVRLQYIYFSPQQLTDPNKCRSQSCCCCCCCCCCRFFSLFCVCSAVDADRYTGCLPCRAGVEIPAWRGSVYARPVTSRITSYCA
jgi:hypothetical protein